MMMMMLTKVVDYLRTAQPDSSDSSYCNLVIAGAQPLGDRQLLVAGGIGAEPRLPLSTKEAY